MILKTYLRINFKTISVNLGPEFDSDSKKNLGNVLLPPPPPNACAVLPYRMQWDGRNRVSTLVS